MLFIWQERSLFIGVMACCFVVGGGFGGKTHGSNASAIESCLSLLGAGGSCTRVCVVLGGALYRVQDGTVVFRSGGGGVRMGV